MNALFHQKVPFSFGKQTWQNAVEFCCREVKSKEVIQKRNVSLLFETAHRHRITERLNPFKVFLYGIRKDLRGKNAENIVFWLSFSQNTCIEQQQIASPGVFIIQRTLA